MADKEYIERNSLVTEIEANINTYWNEGKGGYYLAEDALNDSVKTAPTADVVPKSEVERLEHILDCYALQYGTVTEQQEVIDKAKTEVAREIFEEIEKCSEVALMNGHIETPILCIGFGVLAELKKKYIGEQNEH